MQGSGQHSKCVNLMDINQENYRQGCAGRSPAYLGSKKKKKREKQQRNLLSTEGNDYARFLIALTIISDAAWARKGFQINACEVQVSLVLLFDYNYKSASVFPPLHRCLDY